MHTYGDAKILNIIKNRKGKRIGHYIRKTFLLVDALEGFINGKIGRGRKGFRTIDGLV